MAELNSIRSILTSAHQIIQSYSTPEIRRRYSSNIEALFTCFILLRWILTQRSTAWAPNFTTSIVVEEAHVLYPMLLGWASRYFKKSNRLRAVPPRAIGVEMSDQGKESFHAKQSDMVTSFEPNYGTHLFFQRFRPFVFTRTQGDISNSGDQGSEESITLKTLGWSQKPLKRFIQMVITEHRLQHPYVSSMYRPSERRFWRRWDSVGPTPRRSLESVIMDEKEKMEVIKDMDTFLTSAEWYEEHGVTSIQACRDARCAGTPFLFGCPERPLHASTQTDAMRIHSAPLSLTAHQPPTWESGLLVMLLSILSLPLTNSSPTPPCSLATTHLCKRLGGPEKNTR
jgi:hypothetical protein